MEPERADNIRCNKVLLGHDMSCGVHGGDVPAGALCCVQQAWQCDAGKAGAKAPWRTEMVSLVGMRAKKTLGLGMMLGGLALLGGCSSEIGRVPLLDTDVSCLRKQMKGPMFLSFPLAANTCQRMSNHNLVLGEKNAHPLPLNLKDAPDLQKQADEYGYSYTK